MKKLTTRLTLFTPDGVKPWASDGEFFVACSGGFDSMAIAHFLVRGGRKPHLIHVNHSTGNDKAEDIVTQFAKKHGLRYSIYRVDPSLKDKKESWEEFWRKFRMRVFNEQQGPVITGHNLDDAMETWMFSSINGTPKLIPYQTNNVVRPFIFNRKENLKSYAIENGVEWFEDVSNTDVSYSRNRIRHNIIPEVMQINKGFDSMIIKRYKAKYEK